MSVISTKLVRLWSGQAEQKEERFITNFNTGQLNQVTGLSLKTCTFRNTHPNIFAEDEYPNDSRNNATFSYTIGVTPYSIVVPVTGFYSLDELLDLINPTMGVDFTAANPGSTAVLSLGPRGKVICTIVGAVVEDLVFTGLLNEYLGNTKPLTMSNAGVGVFDSFPELGGLKLATVSLSSKSPQTILNASPNKERHTNSIGSIPITVPYGVMQTFIDPSPVDSMLHFNPPEHFRQVRFVIRDELGRIVKSQALSFGMEVVVHTAQ